MTLAASSVLPRLMALPTLGKVGGPLWLRAFSRGRASWYSCSRVQDWGCGCLLPSLISTLSSLLLAPLSSPSLSLLALGFPSSLSRLDISASNRARSWVCRHHQSLIGIFHS